MAASHSSHQPIVKKKYISASVTHGLCHVKNFTAASSPAIAEQRTLQVSLNPMVLKQAALRNKRCAPEGIAAPPAPTPFWQPRLPGAATRKQMKVFGSPL